MSEPEYQVYGDWIVYAHGQGGSSPDFADHLEPIMKIDNAVEMAARLADANAVLKEVNERLLKIISHQERHHTECPRRGEMDEAQTLIAEYQFQYAKLDALTNSW